METRIDTKDVLEYLKKRRIDIHKKIFYTNYIICSKPDHIVFTCPYCQEDELIDVKDLEEDVFELSEVICPHCGKTVRMGEWEYD